MQESQEKNIDPQTLEKQDAIRDLLLRPDQLGLESIVVLHQILKLRIGPHALLVPSRSSRLLDCITKRVNRVLVSRTLDILQQLNRFGLGLSDDSEAVHREADLVLPAELAGALPNVRDLLLEALERVAVHEVVVRDLRAVLAGVEGVAALEDQGVGTAGEVQGFGRERVVVELVEVAAVGEFVACPDAFEALDEFSTSSVVC